MRLQEGVQHRAQVGRADRAVAERLVQVQVQAGHVDAPDIGVHQVDVGRDDGGRLDEVPAIVLDPHRDLDFVHADPFQLAADVGLRLVGDIRHFANNVFDQFHALVSHP